MLSHMDAQQRARAGRAVQEEMDRQGLTLQRLAEMSRVAPVTLRDLISGKRWPWASKRQAIEASLGWEPGRIAQIAREPAALPVLEGSSVEESLEALLKRSELTPSRRARVMAAYLSEVEEQQRQAEAMRRSVNGASAEA